MECSSLKTLTFSPPNPNLSNRNSSQTQIALRKKLKSPKTIWSLSHGGVSCSNSLEIGRFGSRLSCSKRFGTACAASGGGVSSDEVITLDVSGMMCEGCTSSVKRILESQPQVSEASADLEKKTATIWPIPEARTADNWQQQLGETLAKHLTNCGFQSNLRV
ncbi:hypothetical protein Syun_013606 [Stephania yunnanensis]|uniref:HMA domain-containing protein n=1 Tax=Stephania yunnanensis TaxID=152371 RepID=A0AAP0PB35_9MAGN